MKIGLDSKRIFKNGTGLGVYGRNLVHGLQQVDTQNEYFLFTPQSESSYFDTKQLPNNFKIISPKSISSYYWRSFGINQQIDQEQIDIYHGLSNELPVFINKTKAKSIVDIHDLCFVHYKQDYSKIDQQIFWHKAKRAAQFSDKIIATAETTKKDILKHLKIKEDKIEVVYQCCDASFYKKLDTKVLKIVSSKFNLPQNFVLSVGTIQGRKNQKAIVEALALTPKSLRLPLVLVGNGKKYLDELIALAAVKEVDLKILNKVSFEDLPAIYQLANLFVFPSFIEGFGIPVLEAMASKTPVITSKNTSMAEIIINEDNLINPKNIAELSEKITYFLANNQAEQVAQNYLRALAFSQEKFASDVLKIYKAL